MRTCTIRASGHSTLMQRVEVDVAVHARRLYRGSLTAECYQSIPNVALTRDIHPSKRIVSSPPRRGRFLLATEPRPQTLYTELSATTSILSRCSSLTAGDTRRGAQILEHIHLEYAS